MQNQLLKRKLLLRLMLWLGVLQHSPQIGMLVHHRTIRRYPFILRDKERHCESKKGVAMNICHERCVVQMMKDPFYRLVLTVVRNKSDFE